VSGHSIRAARALSHLAEVDAALAVLALWCRHRDSSGDTRTEGDIISYGPGFETLGLPEQVGLVAHHVLHVALRHSDRQAALVERLGDGFDPVLYGLSADAIINQTLQLAGHPIPRPAVLLTEVLAQAGMAAPSPVAALEHWDADRLAMALHRDGARAARLRAWGKARGFAPDLGRGRADGGAGDPGTTEWRNHMLRALEAGRRAGSGIGRLGAILADLSPDRVPWEVHLRGLLAKALVERPRQSWRRPSSRWLALMAEAERTATPAPAFEPGRQRMDHRARIVIGLDTSSSIDAQTLRLFAAEAEGITRRTGAEAHLLAFDEVVFSHQRLNPEHWTKLRLGALRTGGGTAYDDLFAKAARIQPSLAVILTDLDAPLPPKPPFGVLWAVPAAPATMPAFGRVLVIG